MTVAVPKGYRRLEFHEDVKPLIDAGQTEDLCHCGHLDNAHAGRRRHGPCRICPCPHFIWDAIIVSTTTPV